jgi:hypothetical protein
VHSGHRVLDVDDEPDRPTRELSGHPFPDPVSVISLRRATTYRDCDEDGQPILIISDGVTSVAFDSGLSGLSFGVVAASRRLAEAVNDFTSSITARWQARDRATGGRHRRNRRQWGPRPRRGNNPRT